MLITSDMVAESWYLTGVSLPLGWYDLVVHVTDVATMPRIADGAGTQLQAWLMNQVEQLTLPPGTFKCYSVRQNISV